MDVLNRQIILSIFRISINPLTNYGLELREKPFENVEAVWQKDNYMSH
jgi:hypothetical protein